MTTGDPPSIEAQERRKQFTDQVRSISAGAVAGMLFAVLAVTGSWLLSAFPSLSLSDAELTAWFDDGENQTRLLAGLNITSVSAIMFLWFVAVIRQRLGESEDKFFATVFLGSSLAFVGVWLTGAAMLAAPAAAMTIADASSVSPASASLAAGLGTAMLLVVAPRVQAVVILSTSTVILRSRSFPRWVPVVGYVFGLTMLVIPLVTRPLGLGFPLWVLIVSVEILIQRRAIARPGDEVDGTSIDGTLA